MPASEAEEGIESWSTFEDNAAAKARHFQRVTGLPTFADDSGLSVDALSGQPGVHSKRWSGRTDISGAALDAANNAALLAELHQRSAFPAAAAFVCAAAYCDGQRVLVRVGRLNGTILAHAAGEHGFGYDPHFAPSGADTTLAQLSLAEKSGMSHRARAFTALLQTLFPGSRPTLHKPILPE